MRRSDTLTPEGTTQFERVRAASPGLRSTTELVAACADMMLGLRGDRLETWLQTIETTENLPHLRSFTVGLRRDQDAVTNGLTFKHNSGRVEGSVNKIKIPNGKCTGGLILPYSANGSSTPPDRLRGKWARTELLALRPTRRRCSAGAPARSAPGPSYQALPPNNGLARISAHPADPP